MICTAKMGLKQGWVLSPLLVIAAFDEDIKETKTKATILKLGR